MFKTQFLLLGAVLISGVQAATSFGVVGVYDATDNTNAVDTNSSGNPLSSTLLNDVAGFTTGVLSAHGANTGGVINFGSGGSPSTLDQNTLNITYGGAKTFTISTSVTFFGGTPPASGAVDIRNNLSTITPISSSSALLPNQSGGITSWNFTFGAISNGLIGEAITTAGFTILSRTGAAQDATITWFLSNGTTVVDTENFISSNGGDDTFVSLTAPADTSITGFTIGYGGVTTAATDRRIGIDDLGFITGVVVPEPSSATLLIAAAGLAISRRRRA
jgi:hypothetical protein